MAGQYVSHVGLPGSGSSGMNQAQADAYANSRGASGGSSSSSGSSGGNVNLYNSNTGALLNPGQSYVNAQGQTITQGTPVVNTGQLSGTGAPLTLPTQTDTNNYDNIIKGVTSGQISQTDAQNQGINNETNSLTAMLKQVNDSIGAPPSSADAYNRAQNETGILAKQQKVADLTGQLNTITANGQAAQTSLVGQGRGIPDAIIGGQQAEIGRETAIAALPVSAQLNAAQGNLQMAQQNLNTLFQIYSTDATNAYNYKKDSAMAVYNIASSAEQKKLDSFLANIKDIHDTQQANIAAVQNLSLTLLKNQAPASLLAAVAKTTSLADAIKVKGLSAYMSSPADKLDLAIKQQQLIKAKNDNAASSNLSALSPYTKTDYSGNAYIDLSALSPTDKAKYAKLVPVGTPLLLTAGDASKINAISDTKTNLQNISDSINGILNNKEVPSSQGIGNSIKGALGNANIGSFKAYRTAIINSVQALAGGAGSGLRINKAEIDAAMNNDLPVITGIHADNLQQAQAKLANLNKQLDNWSRQLLGGGNVADPTDTYLNSIMTNINNTSALSAEDNNISTYTSNLLKQ